MGQVISLATRRPVVAVRQVILAEEFPDDSDRELASARRLFIGHQAVNVTTGRVGHVSAVRRVGGQLQGCHWTRDPKAPVSAQRSDWIELGLLSRHLGPRDGGSAA